MIQIVIAEDHRLVREGLKTILQQQASLRVVGEAATGLEAVEQTQRTKPDVLLLDLTLPRMHGLDVLSQLRRQKKTKILIVSMHADAPSVLEAFRLGARGFVLKDSPSNELISAIWTIHNGGYSVSPALEPIVQRAARLNGDHKKGPAEITRRERSVLEKVAVGNSSETISRELGISISTVAKHRASIMRKISARTQADIVLYAIRRNLIQV